MYQLYDKHCLLQHQLRERLASWKWQPLVGDVLARFTDPRHTDVLRLYTAYVNEFPEVLKTFHKLCRASQPFTKFIKVGIFSSNVILVYVFVSFITRYGYE